MTNNSNSDSNINIANLNQEFQETLIHINLKSTYYTLTPAEVDILEEGSNNIWKDLTLASISIGIPCVINAFIEINKLETFIFTAEIFINSVIGGVGILFGFIACIVWKKANNKCKSLITDIKNRPKYKV